MQERDVLVLASASPRRRELLNGAGLRFEVIPADLDERPRSGESAVELARRLALEKARSVASQLGAEPPRWVLGADTIVVRDGALLGKPRDVEDAVAMLGSLLGRSHRVLTGIALCATHERRARHMVVESRVTLRLADEAELRAYAAGGEPLDKAGAYAVQGEGRRFVERVEGSETNVIGLPLDETLALLREAGVIRSAV